MTPTWLQARWLTDIPLTLRDGSARPAGFFTQIARSAVQQVSRKFNLSLCPKEVTEEQKDQVTYSPASYYLTRLKFGPVQEVTKVSVWHGNILLYEVPLSRVRIANAIHRQLQLVPSEEPISGYTLGAAMYGQLWPYGPYQPGMLRVSYKAGFEAALTGTASATKDSSTVTGVGTKFLSELESGDVIAIGLQAHVVQWVVSDTELECEEAFSASVSGSAKALKIPPDLLEYVGLNAALSVIDRVSASGGGEPGVASESISVDGFTESVSRPGAANTKGGVYAAQRAGLQAQADELYKTLRRTFGTRNVSFV